MLQCSQLKAPRGFHWAKTAFTALGFKSDIPDNLHLNHISKHFQVFTGSAFSNTSLRNIKNKVHICQTEKGSQVAVNRNESY